MSLRVRLGLCYGSMAGLAILLVSLTVYAIHTRAHYDDLDRRIRGAAEHVLAEDVSAITGSAGPSLSIPAELDIVVRLFDLNGDVRAQTPNVDQSPSADPRGVLAHPSGPPFDRLVKLGLAIMSEDAGRGAFGLANDADGNRWRLYALPADQSTGYVLAAGPLERIDASVERFRLLVWVLSVVGTGATLACATLMAGRALRPISALTDTASAIARSRRFTSRIPVAVRQDELGRLATTFNVMLTSLEEAFAAQQRFVSDASHELRAPLTAIQANLDLVEQRPAMSEDDRREAIAEAARETRRLAHVVADLLTLARADALVPVRRQQVELDRVVMDAFAEARHFASGHQLRVEHLDPVIVQGDAGRLKQLLLALLDNAIKYTPPAGTVALRLDKLDQSVQVSIRDTGPGIAADDLPHVFERFYRADPARARDPGGTGLGLPIAQWIAHEHAGELSLASTVGQGTTATLILPLSTGPDE